MVDSVKTDSGEYKREGLFIGYVINNEEQFSQVGYKVMKSQEGELFIKSAKVMYNGNIKLLYAIEGYKTLADICRTETIDVIRCSLYKTINGIMKIQENGFLGHENVMLNFTHIYFDETLDKPYFIYIPLVVGETESWEHEFENKFSSELMMYIKNAVHLSISQKQDFLFELGEIPYSLERIRQSCSKYADQIIIRKQENVANGELCLVSVINEVPLKFVINKERFTIGRRKDNDGIVDFSKQISRIHCSIIKRNGKYGVVDENSKYGTKLNSTMCESGKFYELHVGDELKLPAITFRVQ